MATKDVSKAPPNTFYAASSETQDKDELGRHQVSCGCSNVLGSWFDVLRQVPQTSRSTQLLLNTQKKPLIERQYGLKLDSSPFLTHLCLQLSEMDHISAEDIYICSEHDLRRALYNQVSSEIEFGKFTNHSKISNWTLIAFFRGYPNSQQAINGASLILSAAIREFPREIVAAVVKNIEANWAIKLAKLIPQIRTFDVQSICNHLKYHQLDIALSKDNILKLHSELKTKNATP